MSAHKSGPPPLPVVSPACQVGEIEVQCTWVEPGSQQVLMTGNLSTQSRACIRNVVELVMADLSAIASRLGLPTPSHTLVRRGYDLHVHLEHGYQPVRPTYQMGAIFVALVSLLFGRRAREDVMIFGDVSNLGAFSSNWTLQEADVKDFIDEGYRRVILGVNTQVPDAARARALEPHPDDGKPALDLIVAHRILDAMGLYFN